MKLLSLFKFKTKKTDIEPLIAKLFDSVSSNLFLEFQKDIYDWKKADNIKHYECFVLARLLIDYSFSVSYDDLDKNIINSFNKISESVFVELHNKNYSRAFCYDDMKNIIDEKYNLFRSLRNENKPPECWNLIYSSLTNKGTPSEIQAEVIGLKKAINSMKDKPSLNDLSSKFEEGVIRKLKVIESFDLAEILFRQNIRLIKKNLSAIDIPKQLSAKK